MKKASYILLAMMLIIAVFVSCKAEVIDDSDLLVNVTFSSDDNSKGLTWSRDFAPESYYWSYDASKADNGPRTGTATKAKVGGDEGKGLIHDVGPFSVGTWDFTLYGYTDADRTKLVYEGHAQASLAKGSSNPVKVNVSSKDEQAGTILVSKDIRLTDGTNTTYTPTHFSIKNAKDSSPAVDTNSKELKDLEFSTTGDMSYTVKSGSYVVTIEMRNEDDSVVYSSTQIYINVYDYQTTRIGGSLDDVKVSTRFEAYDGTIVGTSSETAINTEGSTTLTTPEGVTPVKSGTTSVVFPQGALGTAQKATLKVIASPTPVSSKFCIEGESSPLAGIDLSAFVDGNAVTNFASPVTVTTYVAKGLTTETINNASDAKSKGLKVIYNGSGDQPTITSYDPTTGMLVFTTSHFSQYYVTSSRIVAVNVDTNVAYTSLKSAVDAVTGSGYITLLKNTTGSEVISIEDGAKKITIDFNGKTYSVDTDISAFVLGKGNQIVLKNGRIKSNKNNGDKALVVNYSNKLTLESINLDCSGVFIPCVLSLIYGETIITGSTSISNKVYTRDYEDNPTDYVCSYNNMALNICNSFSDSYKEGVSVTFDANFVGKVTGFVNFELDKENCYNGRTEYKHSLIIEGSGDFSTAQFCFSRVGCKSFFRMNGSPTCHKSSFYPTTTDSSTGTTTLDFDKAVVLNKTTDAVYEELPRAMNDASTEFENELVLKKNCIIKYLIKQPCEKKLKLDLNGCSITPSEDFDDTDNKTHVYALLRVDNGTLTITNSGGEKGYIDSTINSSLKYGIKVINGGTLIVKNGATIKGKEASISKDDSSTVNNLI